MGEVVTTTTGSWREAVKVNSFIFNLSSLNYLYFEQKVKK